MATELESKAPSLVDEYEFDSEFDPDLHQLPGPVKITAGKEPQPERERGPDGKFLPAEKSEPLKVTHSRYLTRKAKAFGMDDAEIAAMSSDALETVVDKLDAQRDQWLVQRDSERVGRQSEFSNVPGVDDDTVPQRRQPTPQAEQDFKLKYNPDEWHEEAKSLFGQIEQELSESRKDRAELKAIKAQLAGIQSEKVFSDADKGFRDLGPAFEKIVGKGTRDDLTGTKAIEFRAHIIDHIRRHPKQYAGMTSRQSVVAAGKHLYGDIVGVNQVEEPEPQPEKTKSRINGYTPDEWNEGGLARPTHRAGAAEPKGVKRAEKSVAALLREKALGDGDEEQSLPD